MIGTANINFFRSGNRAWAEELFDISDSYLVLFYL